MMRAIHVEMIGLFHLGALAARRLSDNTEHYSVDKGGDIGVCLWVTGTHDTFSLGGFLKFSMGTNNHSKLLP